MRRLLLLTTLVCFLLPSCSKNTGTTVRVVKPKNHHRWFDRKKDKRVKRTKVVRMKG